MINSHVKDIAEFVFFDENLCLTNSIYSGIIYKYFGV